MDRSFLPFFVPLSDQPRPGTAAGSPPARNVNTPLRTSKAKLIVLKPLQSYQCLNMQCMTALKVVHNLGFPSFKRDGFVILPSIPDQFFIWKAMGGCTPAAMAIAPSMPTLGLV